MSNEKKLNMSSVSCRSGNVLNTSFDKRVIASRDADFDSYWDDEARNPNRNRIRIGRQYQATVPPLLKPGESDGRQLSDLETLKWKPGNDLNEQQFDQYLSLAKAVSLFSKAILNKDFDLKNNISGNKRFNNNNNNEFSDDYFSSDYDEDENADENNDDEDEDDEDLNVDNIDKEKLSEQLNNRHSYKNNINKIAYDNLKDSHHYHHHHSTNLSTTSVTSTTTTTSSSSLSSSSSKNCLLNSDKEHPNLALKGLIEFVRSHRSIDEQQQQQQQSKCTLDNDEKNDEDTIDYCLQQRAIENENEKLFKWTSNECNLFAKALIEVGKNFSAIKKEFLPWKSVQSLIEHYYFLASGKLKASSSTTVAAMMASVKSSSNCDDSLVKNVSSTTTTTTSSSSSTTTTITSNATAATFVSANELSTNTNGNKKTLEKLVDNITNDNIDSRKELEVKGMLAKPLLEAFNNATIPATTATANANSTAAVAAAAAAAATAGANLGSLKFYLDGQLVLKLNAQQEMNKIGDRVKKCHWVESSDTPKILPKRSSRSFRRNSKKILLERNEQPTNDHKQSGHIHNDKCMHSNSNGSVCGSAGSGSTIIGADDCEDISLDSSDEDSSIGSESSNLTSGGTPTSASKKARIKIESSNCYIPSASPSSVLNDHHQISQHTRNMIASSSPSSSPSLLPYSVSTIPASSLSSSSSSTTTFAATINSIATINKLAEDELRRKMKLPPWPPDKTRMSSMLESAKWSSSVYREKVTQPPAAHASSNRLSGSGSSGNSSGIGITNFKTSINTSTSNNFLIICNESNNSNNKNHNTSILANPYDSFAPVDLTRKSFTNSSPRNAKSPSNSSSSSSLSSSSSTTASSASSAATANSMPASLNLSTKHNYNGNSHKGSGGGGGGTSGTDNRSAHESSNTKN